MESPGLSACLITNGGPERLSWWVSRVRRFADEILIAVDMGGPGTASQQRYEAASDLADVVLPVKLEGLADPARTALFEEARGDWITFLDDDESLEESESGTLTSLLSDRSVNSYYIPRRWVARDPAGRVAVLRQAPWYPEPTMRLWRNRPRGWFAEPVVHTPVKTVGPSVSLDPDGPLRIYHLDLLWNPRAARERKANRYQRLADAAASLGESRVNNQEHYLYEDYVGSLKWEALELDDPGLLECPSEGRARHWTPREVPRPIELKELEAKALRRRAEGLADPQPAGVHPEQWSAECSLVDGPTVTTANRGEVARVRVRNTSGARWRTAGIVDDRVVIGTRWRTAGFGDELPMAGDTLLPHSLQPGQEAKLDVLTWTPRIPGRYELVIEPLHQGHAWFSQLGVAPLVLPVTVLRGTAPLAARHFAGRLPDDPQPAQGQLVRYVMDDGGVCLHDSLRGPVLAGQQPGKLSVGQVVVLRLAGAGVLPLSATSLTMRVTLWDASCAGSVALFPTDGSLRSRQPGIHFEPGAVVTETVRVDCGRGRGWGRVSVAVRGSGGSLRSVVRNPRAGAGGLGDVHYRLELVDYLAPPAPDC